MRREDPSPPVPRGAGIGKRVVGMATVADDKRPGSGGDGDGARAAGSGVGAAVGWDPVLGDLIATVNRPGFDAWAAGVARIGGCAHPLHMRGATTLTDAAGNVVAGFSSADAPGGVVLVGCGNRREAVCPACARLYWGDTYALVRAGLLGGKGVPESVARHVRVFVTLTAPGFGAVHSARVTNTGNRAPCHPRRGGPCTHGRATSCLARHGDDDPLVGAPLCPDCYDYPAAVIWQASVGAAWRRFTDYVPRHLAGLTGRTRKQVKGEVALSYVKMVEYQRRGLVHVHALIRADNTVRDRIEPGPGWVTPDLLADAVRGGAGQVAVKVDGGPVGSWVIRWGSQVDVADLTAADDSPQAARDARRAALYVAKYATKATEATGWAGRRGDGSPRAVHAERMVTTALDLAPVPELAGLNLGRWARHLAYRGHVSSRSRRYSTTLGALRQARADHQRDRHATATPDGEGSGVVRESSWRLAGHGYTPGQAFIAASIARDGELNREAARDAAQESARVERGSAATEAGAALPGGRVGLRKARRATDGSGARTTDGRQP
jgi:hypothetical protein